MEHLMPFETDAVIQRDSVRNENGLDFLSIMLIRCLWDKIVSQIMQSITKTQKACKDQTLL